MSIDTMNITHHEIDAGLNGQSIMLPYSFDSVMIVSLGATAGRVSFSLPGGQDLGSVDLAGGQARLNTGPLSFVLATFSGFNGLATLAFRAGGGWGSGDEPGPGPVEFPLSPPLLSAVDLGGPARCVKVYGDYAYAALSSHPALAKIIDISTGAVVSEILRGAAPLETQHGYWMSLDEQTDTLYIGTRKGAPYEVGAAAPNGSIVAVDVSDKTAPVVLSTLAFQLTDAADAAPVVTTIDLFRNGDSTYLAVAGNMFTGSGFGVVNVTDPANMVLEPGYIDYGSNPTVRPHGLRMRDDGLAVTGDYSSYRKVIAFDVSNPSAASVVGWAFPDATDSVGGLSQAWGVDIFSDGVSAIAWNTSIANRNAGTGWLGLRLIDTRNAVDRMAILGESQIPWNDLDTASASDQAPTECLVVERGDKKYALINNGNKGVAVFDCTDYATPIFKGNCAPSGVSVIHIRMMGVTSAQEKIVMVDGVEGATNAKAYICELEW